MNPEELLPYLPYLYLGVINLISVLATLYDKAVSGLSYRISPKKEKRNGKESGKKKKTVKLRIPEATLLLLAALGGSVGMFLTMLLIRHKTKKPKFMVGIPVILLLQIAAVFFVFRWF